MTHRPDLPGVLSEIAAAAGEDAARKLAAARGGTEMFIPQAAEGSLLAEIVGVTAARKVIAELGPGRVMLPAGAWRGAGGRRRRGMAMLAEGQSLSAVALATGVDRRTVSRWREELEDDRQIDLPFET